MTPLLQAICTDSKDMSVTVIEKYLGFLERHQEDPNHGGKEGATTNHGMIAGWLTVCLSDWLAG